MQVEFVLGAHANARLGASITLPVMLLYLAAFAEVSKMAVTAVASGGVGMKLSCCMKSRTSKASSYPCTAANCTHITDLPK